jgi:hypothetical protein
MTHPLLILCGQFEKSWRAKNGPQALPWPPLILLNSYTFPVALTFNPIDKHIKVVIQEIMEFYFRK